ncbi:hypothetical protein Cgig2_004359 [Carnegiea gigantea]|uniref:Uncharacterized protein n=1 Tax=Carnegiea gigantea TaxID=171969 RepID=A0A9Q1GUC3_9CARY|nr:hypothetical protein Cgig2_004359 [Carnegiea gigantea]
MHGQSQPLSFFGSRTLDAALTGPILADHSHLYASHARWFRGLPLLNRSALLLPSSQLHLSPVPSRPSPVCNVMNNIYMYQLLVMVEKKIRQNHRPHPPKKTQQIVAEEMQQTGTGDTCDKSQTNPRQREVSDEIDALTARGRYRVPGPVPGPHFHYPDPVATVSEVLEGDSSRKVIEMIFRSGRTSFENRARIERILKVHNPQTKLAQFEEY